MRREAVLAEFVGWSLLFFPAATVPQANLPSEQSNFSKEDYVFETLHTLVRFEADGTGKREITGKVRVQSESATHNFGLLRFGYASSFESLSIECVRVRKPDGTTVETPTTDDRI